MRADLTTAMKARDGDAVRTLRTALAAIANAEAPPVESAPRDVVGRLVEHHRIDLTDDDVEAVLRAQTADRADTAATYRANARDVEADALEH
ncbi:MAG: hypothetical protein JWM12_2809 [Ilumatobacteraceae bacterium]|nr:hypothetical protein [Ilumatobacteraceae bacterium]